MRNVPLYNAVCYVKAKGGVPASLAHTLLALCRVHVQVYGHHVDHSRRTCTLQHQTPACVHLASPQELVHVECVLEVDATVKSVPA